MKLGHRLQQLNLMIPDGYDHIWDCCCDHGRLGMTLLQRNAAETIHFVDSAPNVMVKLETALAQYFPHSRHRWQAHCLDVTKLDLAAYTAVTQKQLVIIAGVGGDRVIELVNAMMARHIDWSIDFLLCPVHHNYKVRELLRANQLGLLNEKLVCENKRFYELIYVSPHATQPISAVGSVMWDFARQECHDYLVNTIAYYQRKVSHEVGRTAYTEILEAYQRLQIRQRI
ncbi:MAG: tRNA (adenine(22)-N(1))-methyltransferase TrmK [Chloroflexota bacterium]